MSREDNIDIFRDTMDWCKTSPELSESIMASISGTRLYSPEEMLKNSDKRYANTEISVSKSRTFEAAFRLHTDYPEMKIGVLNFASAVHPGGGVQKGCSAQEESLCRCSTLFPVLDTSYLRKNYYDFNKSQNNRANTDAVIFTPGIYVVKSDTSNPERLEAEKRVSVDVLTVAAPDLREIYIDDARLLNLHLSRAKRILGVAAENGIDILVLGAFGCGAFGNNPYVVAKAYKEVLPEFDGFFKAIEFAIYCSSYEMNNFTAFCDTLLK